MRSRSLLGLCAIFVASIAAAHSGVQNEAVKARMHGMMEISQATKSLGQMARGAAAFDRDEIAPLVATLESEATRIPALFEAQEDDPKSEALPSIWENWADFKGKAEDMGAAATALAASASADELNSAMRALGQTCSACHKAYRE